MKIGDKLTVWLLALGVLGFLLSLVNTGEQFFAGADTHLAFGPNAIFEGPQIIGLSCVFVNEGARQDAISFLTAEIEGERQKFRSVWSSTSTTHWALAQGLAEKTEHETEFMNFVPIVVPSRSNAAWIVWFKSDNNFAFQARNYNILVRGYGSNFRDVRVTGVVQISLPEETVKDLKAGSYERVVRTQAWQLPPD